MSDGGIMIRPAASSSVSNAFALKKRSRSRYWAVIGLTWSSARSTYAS